MAVDLSQAEAVSQAEAKPLAVPGLGPAAKRRLAATALTALVLGIGLLQIDAALGGVEVPGQPSSTLSAVGAPLDLAQSRAEARCAWRAWSAEAAVVETGQAANCAAPIPPREQAAGAATVARGLVRLAFWIDLVFVLCYLNLAYRISQRVRYRSRVLSTSPLRNGLLWLTGPVPTVLLGVTLLSTELAEDLAQWALAAEKYWLSVDRAAAVLAIATPIKLAGLLLLVVPLLLLTLDTLGARAAHQSAAAGTWWDRQRPPRRVVRLLRIPLALIALFAAGLLLPLGEQAPDALLHWADGRRGFGGFAAAASAATLFALMVWSSGHLAVAAEERLVASGRRPPVSPRHLTIALLVVAAAAVWPPLRNLGGLALVLAALVGLQWCVCVAPWRKQEPERLRSVSSPRGATPGEGALAPGERKSVLDLGRLLAAAVLFLLSFALVRASALPLAVGLASPEPLEPGIVVLFASGVFGLATALCLARWLTRMDEMIAARHLPWSALTIHRGLGLAALGWGATAAVWPHPVAVATGVVGITALALASALLVAGEASRWAERTRPIAGLRVLGFGRTPVFLLAAAWFLAALLFDTGEHHDVRLLRTEAGTAAAAQVGTVRDRFDTWLRANCAAPGNRPGTAVPLVVAAAGGGGLRAAYWTAGVLDRLTATDPRGRPVDPTCPTATPTSRVFALSGVSGGGLGIMSFAAEAAETRVPRPGWYRNPLGSDHLSPILARSLFIDLPRSLTGFPYPDRAVALEKSLESVQSALGQPFLGGDAAQRGRVPLIVVNGTSVESGCRIATAPSRLGPGPDGDPRDSFGAGPFECRSLDSAGRLPGLNETIDYLCPGSDLRRSTAVLLGARFPWVSPAGRLRNCDPDDMATYVADGGYSERTGARVAAELTTELQRLVAAHNAAVPRSGGRVVQAWALSIDNGYVTRAAPQQLRTPLSVLVPFRTALAVREAQNWADQQSLARSAPDRFVRVTPTRVPGVQAPLGWVLSEAAQRSLERQLDLLDASMSWSELRQAVHGAASPSN